MLPDQDASKALGGRLAELIRPGDVIALRGALGAGKTENWKKKSAGNAPER